MAFKAIKPNKPLAISTYVITVYLIWDDWDRVSWEDEHFQVWGLLNLICLGWLIILGIYSITKTIRYRAFRVLLIPILIFWVLQLRLLEGRAVFAWHDCDFSLCKDVSLKETGIWRTETIGAYYGHKGYGTFDVKNDTVYLYDNFSHLNLASRWKLRKAIHGHRVKYRHMGEHQYEGEWPDW